MHPDLSRLSVLIVDDDADSRGLLREVLHACGARVVEADNIPTARGYVGNLKFDMIVTDLALPGEDGAMFLKWLRQQPPEKGGTAPVVAVTAYHEKYPPTELGGWAAYFQKPIDPEELVKTIADLLNLPRSPG